MTQDDPNALRDTVLLNDLATIHIMFGLHTTALSFLELSNWIQVDQVTTLRLMAKAYFNIKHSTQVLHTLNRLEQLVGAGGLSEEETLLKGRSLALLGQTEKARDVLFSVYTPDPQTLRSIGK